MRTKRLLPLFWTMLKIGLFTFGGGYAMLVLLEGELVAKRRWIEKEEFLDMVAIAESTPGPIAINAATYVGYRMSGVVGAGVATVAVCLPSFLIIFAISLFFDAFLTVQAVANAFRGIRVCVVYLILSAGVKMLRSMQKSLFSVAILITVVGAMVVCSVLAVNFTTVFYILIAGGISVFLYVLKRFPLTGRKLP